MCGIIGDLHFDSWDIALKQVSCTTLLAALRRGRGGLVEGESRFGAASRLDFRSGTGIFNILLGWLSLLKMSAQSLASPGMC